MSTIDLTSRYASEYIDGKSRDRFGYDYKYRPKTGIIYSALQDLNNR
jgi:hypothetical protein